MRSLENLLIWPICCQSAPILSFFCLVKLSTCEITPLWTQLTPHVQSIIHQSKMYSFFSHTVPYMCAQFCVRLYECVCVCVCVCVRALYY